MNKELHDFIGGTLATHAELMNLGMSSKEALNIASFPSELNALRDTLGQMKVYELEELINGSKDIPVALDLKKGLYFLSGIENTLSGVVFEYTDIHLGADWVRVPIHELTYNQIQNIWKVIREVA